MVWSFILSRRANVSWPIRSQLAAVGARSLVCSAASLSVLDYSAVGPATSSRSSLRLEAPTPVLDCAALADVHSFTPHFQLNDSLFQCL
eukprot:5052215-Amphidinium_carterae.1